MPIRPRSTTLSLLLALGALGPSAALAAPTWQHVISGEASPPPGRVGAVIVALPDGTSLLIGGRSADEPSSAAVERLFPGATKSVLRDEQPLNVGRRGHTATLLPDGRVLVAGGLDPDGKPLASVEIGTVTLDASPGTASIAWELHTTPGEALGDARAFHTATVLPSGKVLVIGGRGASAELATVESFDPFAKNGAGKWNGVAPLPADQGRSRHTATLLRDGRVLVAGGVSEIGASNNAWVLDPKAPSGNPWKPDQLVPKPTKLVMKSARAGHHAVLMPSGQVLLVGGCEDFPQETSCLRPAHEALFTPDAETGSWETFSPVPGATSPAGVLMIGQSVVGLRSGWVLAVFGRALSGGDIYDQLETFVLRPTKIGPDSPTGSIQLPLLGGSPPENSWAWYPAPAPPQPAQYHSFSSVSLDASGSVVLAGGLQGSNYLQEVSYLRYLPDGAECASGAPLDCAGGVCLDSCVGDECAKACLTARLDGILCDQGAQCASRHCEQGPSNSPSFCCAIECPDVCSDDQTSLKVGTCGATCGEANVYCKGFLCKEKACQESCSAPTDCAVGHYCEGAACVERKSDGATCAQGYECTSGTCADGVCCATACDGACEACAGELTGEESGLCRARLPGQEARAGTCLVDAGDPCGNVGTCDGNRKCTLAAAQTPCGAGTLCTSDTQVSVQACDGFGVCNGAVERTCLPYVCDASGPGCLTGCDPALSDGNGQNPACGPQSFCSGVTRQCVEGTVCLDDGRYLDTSGKASAVIDCRPNHLCRPTQPSACAGECRTALDCKPGNVCRADGACTPPATPSTDDPDCYCAQPGRRPAPGAPALLVGLAAGLALSRRRRAASS